MKRTYSAVLNGLIGGLRALPFLTLPLLACGETFEMKARQTLTPVELNLGDVCRFTLANGETRTVEYLGGSSAVLEVPTTEGLIATFTMRLRVDGAEIPFRRYLATQESFYEPAVVDGLRIFPDSTLEYLTNTVPMRYPSKGTQRHHPWKDARIVLQDATLPLCPEKLHPWFVDKRIDDLLIPIGDCYHGGDCWLGPFSLGEAHGGLDIRMPKGDLLYAPFACDTQFMPLWLNRNRGASSRWRGIRRWPDGTLWTINTSHVIDAVVPEHTAVTNGQPYCTAAGTVVGEYNHTHFELHVHRDLNPPDIDWDAGWGQGGDVRNDCPTGQPEFYNLDPWMLFWQTFRQLRDARGDLVAEIAPFAPAVQGRRTTFRSARPIPAGLTAVWTFNDGTMHVGETVDHVFAAPGAHMVTLTLTDFAARRVRDTAVIVVSEGADPVSHPGVRADDESFVELKPGDLPAWGEKVVRDPFTVARADDLIFFSRRDGAPLTPRLASVKTVAPGVEWRAYSTDSGEMAEVFVRAPRTGERKLLQTATEVAPDFKTPCFWVQHQYDGKRRSYDVNGGRAEAGQFVRYRPNLRAGRWRISATYAACHQPGTAYWVTVKAKDGLHRVRFEPLKNRAVGSFDFAEGDGGYVQIDAADSVGQIAIGPLKFEPERLDPLSWLAPDAEAALRDEKASLETFVREAFEPYKSDPAGFCADDWAPVSKVLPRLVGYPDGQKLFKALAAWAEPLDTIPGSPEAWDTVAEWLGTRCWHRPSLLSWKRFIAERRFVPAVRTEQGLRIASAARRLAEINTWLGLSSAPSPAAPSLEAAFDRPPQSAGAWAWWHWCGGNVSRAGITRDLEAMRDAGLGGATMFNIQAKGTEEPMENALDPAFGYRNDEYWRLLEFATAEAKRLGLRLGAHNCTGYSTAGGPWIAPEQSMKKVVWTKAKVPDGATPESVVLPQPETVRGFYRDIGRVTVGDTVYRFGFTSTGKLTHPAPPDIADRALEADKMDAAAINHHWDNVLAGFLAHVPPSDPGFTHILIDSYEAGPSNWTWDFREEFTRRRGYDPVPKLPALDQAFSEEENARFASDLARTVKELYTERYYDVSYARVRASGYELHLEPYSGPFDSWDAAARCDVPMTEFWQGPVPWSKTVREGGGTWMAGPVGRAYGRSIAGAESFTACPTADHWSYAPRHLKRAIDISLVQGINRFSLHDWVHQPLPPQYLPGFSMGFWGTHFGENQTWHEPGKAMYRYMQRCQALLQRGRQESDALGLVYTDDPTDDGIGIRDFLRDVDVTDDGRVRVVPSGRTYPLLLLNPKGDYAAPEVLEKLQRLLADGATVAAPKGLLVPAGKGRLIEGFSRRTVLSTLRIKPPFEVIAAMPALGDKSDVRAIGRMDGDVRFYFVANTSDTDYTLGALFRSAGKAPEIWFPADGRKDKAPCWRPEGDRTRVDFVLPAHTSAFVVFDRPGDSPSGPSPEPAAVRTAPVAGPWRVGFQSGRGAPDGALELTDLVSLTTRDEPGVRYFSGTATYETTFDLAERPTDLTLDLGDVRDIAEVELNGIDLGVAWYAPFRVNATRAAKAGANRLVVKVTNCWQNRLLGDRRLPQDTPHDAKGKKLAGEVQGLGIRRLPDWLLQGGKSPTGRICFTTWDYFAFKPDEPLAPSGLLGPVRLLIGEERR